MKRKILAKLVMLVMGIMLGLNAGALVSSGMTVIVMAMLGLVIFFEFLEDECFRQLGEFVASTVLGVQIQRYFETPVEFSVLITIVMIIAIVVVIVIKNILTEAGIFTSEWSALNQGLPKFWKKFKLFKSLEPEEDETCEADKNDEVDQEIDDYASYCAYVEGVYKSNKVDETAEVEEEVDACADEADGNISEAQDN